MLVEIPDPEVILGVILAFLIGLGGLYLFFKIRPFIKSSSDIDDPTQTERLEYYERQLIDMKIRLDALEIQGIDEKPVDPNLELKQFMQELVENQESQKEVEVIKEPEIIVEKPDENNEEAHTEENQEELNSKASSEFALKLVNALKSLNNEEITHYEMVNLFNSPEELRCLILFIRALPYNPIVKIYPEAPFLFFKGISVPQSFDLSEEMARDIETFMRGQNSEYYSDLRLHDLEQPFIDAYESAIRIYNDMVEKTRDSYHASVKLAKSQVFEISAVFVCLFVLILTLIGVS